MPDRGDGYVRDYSAEELKAARVLSMYDEPRSGVLYFAGGDWWPTNLERRAKRYDKMAAACRLLAPAMRREIAADPITGQGVSDA